MTPSVTLASIDADGQFNPADISKLVRPDYGADRFYRDWMLACLDGWPDGPGRGSYYYRRYLEPIPLSEEGEEGGWVERAPGSDSAVTASWKPRAPTRLVSSTNVAKSFGPGAARE